MTKITNDMIHACYRLGRLIQHEQLSQKNALDKLESELGMNRKSALAYLHNHHCMANGVDFTRTMSSYGTRYFLEQFYADDGVPGLTSL